MFNGNKIMFIIPIFVVLFIFAGGAVYIQQSESVNNEGLREKVSWNTSFIEHEDDIELSAEWNWEAMPENGLIGDDYIGITFIDGEGDPIASEEFKEAELELLANGEVQQTVEGKKVEDGVLFSFPNRSDNHLTLGHQGELKVTAANKDDIDRTIISYLHTWEEHDGLTTEDPRFFEPEFNGADSPDEFLWVIERFVEIDGEAHE